MRPPAQPSRFNPPPNKPTGLFRDRDFLCLWWVGLASFLIRWLEILVFGVFTYQATGSAFTVAMMTMLRLLPMALFGAALGTLAERIVRHQALLLVVSGSLLTSLILTVISYAGHLEVWHLAALSGRYSWVGRCRWKWAPAPPPGWPDRAWVVFCSPASGLPAFLR